MNAWGVSVAVVALAASVHVHAQTHVIEATTSTGEKVRLLPDGRWEYIDPKKQAAMPTPAPGAAAAQSAPAVPQAPAGSAASAPTQGGLFGIGRTIQPGDPDYNRGSLNPRGR
jgi:hypothetical protein